MKFNSQICTTKEQSERLLALGLKKETADMYYTNASLPFEKDKFHLECKDYSQLQKEVISQICPFTFIPAWSLHRLIEMIPLNLRDKKGYTYDFLIEDDNTISYYYFSEESWYCTKYWGKDNLYDNFIDCIEWLIKEGYFNKEYLEE